MRYASTMLVPLFLATLGVAAVRSEGEQLELGFQKGFPLRPLAGVVTVLGKDGVLYDLDEQGLAHPSTRTLRAWRHHLLLVPPELQETRFDTEQLQELVAARAVLLLTLEERKAVPSAALAVRL